MQLENATKNSKGLQKVKPGDLNWLQLTSADSTSTINYVVNILQLIKDIKHEKKSFTKRISKTSVA